MGNMTILKLIERGRLMSENTAVMDRPITYLAGAALAGLGMLVVDQLQTNGDTQFKMLDAILTTNIQLGLTNTQLNKVKSNQVDLQKTVSSIGLDVKKTKQRVDRLEGIASTLNTTWPILAKDL